MFIQWIPWLTKVFDAVTLILVLATIWWMHRRGLRGAWQFWQYLASITGVISSWWLSGIPESIATFLQVTFSMIVIVLIGKSIQALKYQNQAHSQPNEMEQVQ